MTIDVESAALDFAQEVQNLLDGVLPIPSAATADDRVVQASTLVGGSRYQVQTATRNGQIVLTKDDQPLAHLRVLEELGYTVTAPPDGPASGRQGTLRRWQRSDGRPVTSVSAPVPLRGWPTPPSRPR